MPNWLHLVTNFVYHLGLALWIGGAVALGALVAPLLFRALPRHQAGAIFGPSLRRFARVRLFALVATIAAAAFKHLVFEQNAGPWILIRWGLLAFMAASVLYEIGYLERALEARRVHLSPEMNDDHPARRDFNALHRRAETLMKASVLAAAGAMLLS
jgi:putative copper export protein